MTTNRRTINFTKTSHTWEQSYVYFNSAICNPSRGLDSLWRFLKK